ncbi:MAG: tRNA pseudouridine(13) synthase TruD [Phycisphaerales bacterium]|nr:tRNA pseudouridine(13) synthase TruD [Phycisphaerales bacterium]
MNTLGASIKKIPDDFKVEEIPLYETSGEGEHLYIYVQKTNMSHEELVRNVAKEFGVSRKAVGCAGRKDLRATTKQMLSIHLTGQNGKIPETIKNIKILSSSRHSNKLRLGHLSGNKFVIRIRDIDLTKKKSIKDKLLTLSKAGLPNYFGPQRFGNKGNNHELGLAVATENWELLMDLLLCGEEKHNKFVDELDYKRALECWPFGQPAERNILESLAKGKSPEQASMAISKSQKKLWINSLQSSIFNSVLDRRIENNTWNCFVVGDLAWNFDGGGRTFEVTSEDIVCESMHSRLNNLSISPTGPIWGSKMRSPSDEVKNLEESVINSYNLDESNLSALSKYASGTRRPLRVPVFNPKVESGSDENGDFIQTTFSLPAGSYATVVISNIVSKTLNI